MLCSVYDMCLLCGALRFRCVAIMAFPLTVPEALSNNVTAPVLAISKFLLKAPRNSVNWPWNLLFRRSLNGGAAREIPYYSA
jgi:hypothetical protein